MLLNENEAFSVGNSINACTKGLWIYKEIVKVNGKNVLLLDTEGLGAMDVSKKSDTRLFFITLEYF